MQRFIIIAIITAACGNDVATHPGIALGHALVSACPFTNPNDVQARDACADALTDLPELRDATSSPILWGGQPEGVSPDALLDEANLTQFDPRVWRRMYLSLYMFAGTPKIERSGDYDVVRMPAWFRYGLDAGNYPYPFWHSEQKWLAYERATEVIFVYKGSQIPVAVRTTPDISRPHNERMWDGAWTWNGGQEPRVSLYTYLFSASNPYVSQLDTAYRALEEVIREQNCTACHDPSNAQMMKHLELLNYPNQAIGARRDIVRLVQANAMPPGVGIPDVEARNEIVRRAAAFIEAGDAALSFEGEPVPQTP